MFCISRYNLVENYKSLKLIHKWNFTSKKKQGQFAKNKHRKTRKAIHAHNRDFLFCENVGTCFEIEIKRKEKITKLFSTLISRFENLRNLVISCENEIDKNLMEVTKLFLPLNEEFPNIEDAEVPSENELWKKKKKIFDYLDEKYFFRYLRFLTFLTKKQSDFTCPRLTPLSRFWL